VNKIANTSRMSGCNMKVNKLMRRK